MYIGSNNNTALTVTTIITASVVNMISLSLLLEMIFLGGT